MAFADSIFSEVFGLYLVFSSELSGLVYGLFSKEILTRNSKTLALFLCVAKWVTIDFFFKVLASTILI